MIILIKTHTHTALNACVQYLIYASCNISLLYNYYESNTTQNLNPSHLVSLQKSGEKSTPNNYKKCTYTINYSLSVYLEDGLITLPDLVTVCVVSVGLNAPRDLCLMKPDHWHTDLQCLRLKIRSHHPHT